MLQSLNPSGKPSHFHTKQPSAVTTLPHAVMPRKKTYHVTRSVPSYHPSGSPPVAMSVHTIILTSVTPTSFPSNFPSKKTSDKPIIHPLQAPTGLKSLVPSIQASDFPTYVPSLYSSSRPSGGTSNFTIPHNSLNPIV